MLDLHEGILELFAEAQRKGRRERIPGIVFLPLVYREASVPPTKGVFRIPDPYRPPGGVTILTSPARVTRHPCPTCGAPVEWREGLSARQAIHLSPSVLGQPRCRPMTKAELRTVQPA